MKYTYSEYAVAQVRLWRHEEPNVAVGIALYNTRKNRIYIHTLETLTDNDINAIREFIMLMKQGARE